MRLAQGIRTVAAIEAAKGLVVLLAGFGLFALLHRDVQQFAETLVRHAHLNPASHTPRVFIDYAGRLNDARLQQLAAAAFEAYGLWFERMWGEGFAAASGAIYLPFELRELIHRPSVLSACLLLVNLGVVLFMVYSLRRRMAGRKSR
jgi:uncharacterized membrane protein (DUF2068 family)